MTKTITGLCWGVLIGAIVLAIIGFGFGGWVTGGTAQEMASEMARKAVVDSLTPICVARFQEDPNKEEKFKELEKINSWSRNEYVKKQGWSTIPGQKKHNRDVANECARRIIDLKSKK